jgi:peptidoglycan hydrolase-like protein with peptidoglycan-binding domain
MDVNKITPLLKAKNWTGFAKRYNGPATSGYDTKLKNAYNTYISTTLTSNPESTPTDEVSQLQIMLNSVGSYGLTVDGKIGTSTRTAIRDFQLKNGLTVDGLYGPITKETLQKIYLAKSTKQQHSLAGGVAGIGVAGTAISQAAGQVQQFAGTSQIIEALFIGLVVIGVGLTVFTLFFKKA